MASTISTDPKVTQVETGRTRSRFLWLNGAAAVLHTANAAVLSGLVFGGGKDWSVPVLARYALWEKPDGEGDCDPVDNPCTIREKTEVLFNASLGTLVVIFTLLSVLNHVVFAVALFRTKSTVNIRNKKETGIGVKILRSYMDESLYRNALRWAEYSVSAGVMLYIIAALSGLSSLYDLLWIMAAVFATMWLGHATDCARDHVDRIYLYTAGCVVHTLTWTPIVYAFTKGTGSSDAPSAVKALIWVLLAFYASFGAVPFFQYFVSFGARKTGQAARNRRAEAAYIILSYVSKTCLTWLVYSGVFMRDQFGIEVE